MSARHAARSPTPATRARSARWKGLGAPIFFLFWLGLLGVTFLGVLGVTVYGVSTFIDDLIIAKRAQTAEAVVLSVRQDTFCNSSTYGGGSCYPVYFPKVRFTTTQGEQVDAETVDWSADKSRANVGRSLKVYYDPLNPHHVQRHRWLNNLDVEVVLGLALWTIALLIPGLRQVAARVKKRRSRQKVPIDPTSPSTAKT